MFWNTFTIPRSKSTMALILWLTYTTSCKLGSKNDQIWDLWSTNQKRITYVHNMHVQGVQKCTNRMLLEPWCTDSITTALNFGYDFVLLLHFFGPSRVAEVGSRMQKWPQNFHHAHICYFRDKFVVFARNCKFANLIQHNMQYIPCNSALPAQETLFFTRKTLFLPKVFQKVRKSRQILIFWQNNRAQNFRPSPNFSAKAL